MDCKDTLTLIISFLSPGEFAALARVNQYCAAVCRDLAKIKKRTFVIELQAHDISAGVLLADRKVLHGRFIRSVMVDPSCVMDIHATYVRGQLHSWVRVRFRTAIDNSGMARAKFEMGSMISWSYDGNPAHLKYSPDIFVCECGNQVIAECPICNDTKLKSTKRIYEFDG